MACFPAALNRTTAWIQSALEELLLASFPPEKPDNAGKGQPPLPGPVQILNAACLRFLTWDFSKTLVPEVIYSLTYLIILFSSA